MKNYLLIEKIDYLKYPVYRWAYMTEEGGCFTNSGHHKSLKKALRHYIFSGGNGINAYERFKTKVKLVEISTHGDAPVGVTLVDGMKVIDMVNNLIA